MRRPRQNYRRKLARKIALNDGTVLVTLFDAGALLLDRFSTVTRWGTLEYAIETLTRAGESGKREHIIAATDLIERVLRARHML